MYKIETANNRPITPTCAICKVLEDVGLLVLPNISQNKTFSLNNNMGSGKRGPARHNLSLTQQDIKSTKDLSTTILINYCTVPFTIYG